MGRILFPKLVSGGVPRELEATVGGVRLRGSSVVGRATALAVPQFGVALDLGRLSETIVAQPVVLLSHAHLDHSAALLAYLNLRARCYPSEPPLLVVPEELVAPYLTALAAMPGLESVRKRLDLEAVVRGVGDGDEVPVPGGWARAFARQHSVPTLGWALRRPGEPRPRLVYAADGVAAQFAARPELLDAEVAVVECSFVEGNHRLAAALAAHTHLADWLELAPKLAARVLVLAHLPVLPRQELAAALQPLASVLPPGCRLVAWAE